MDPSHDLDAVLGRCASAVFSFLDLVDATVLRATSVGMRAAVAAHAWDDAETEVNQAPSSWRSSFPSAIAVRSRCADASWLRIFGGTRTALLRASPLSRVTDDDVAALAGAESVSLRLCSLPQSLSHAAFGPLRGRLRVLDVGQNAALCVTDALLAALAAGPGGSAPPPLAELCFEMTDASYVTAAGWAALAGIRVLRAHGSRIRVTDGGLAALAAGGALEHLDLRKTDRSALTDAGVLAATQAGGVQVCDGGGGGSSRCSAHTP